MRLWPGQVGKRLSHRLLMLVLAVVVPLVLVRSALLWAQYRAERAQAEAQLVEQARVVSRLVDREFEGAWAVARTLAASAARHRGDLGTFSQELVIARNMLSEDLPVRSQGAAVSLVDARSVRQLDSETADGSGGGWPVTDETKAAIASGRPQVSNLFVGARSGLPRIAVAVPVFATKADTDGHAQVVGAVRIALPRDRLVAVVAAIGLPPSTVVSVQDRKGATVARSVRDAETVGDLPTPAVLKAILNGDAGLVPPDTETLEGVPSTIAFAHAPKSDYIITLDVPDRVILAPLWRSIASSVPIALTVLAGGLVLAFLLARRIVVALNRIIPVAEAAVASGGHPAPTGLLEADRLAAALAANLGAREHDAAFLRQALATKRALIDNSPVGVVVADTSGRVYEANDAYLAIVGRTRVEFEANGLDWRNLATPEWLRHYEAAITETAAGGRSAPFEREYIRPDGTRVPVLVSLGLIDEAAQLGAAFFIDLSEREAAIAALRESEERLRLTMRGIFATAFTWEVQEDRVIRHYDSIPGLLRSGTGQLCFADLVAGVHPDDRAVFEANVRLALETNNPYRNSFRVALADGSLRWLEAWGTLVRDELGRPKRLVGVAMDVTGRKEAELALAESEARLSLALKGAQIAVHEIDFAHDVSRVDAMFARLADSPVPPGVWLPLNDDIRREGYGRIHSEDAPARQACLDRLHRGDGSEAEVEFRMFRRDGTLMWLHQQFLVTERDPVSGSARRLLGLTWDVTQARDMQAVLERLVDERTRELRETQTRLAHTERMQALGQLAGGIAHDFNNVLQAVLGGSALLARRRGNPAEIERLADLIQDAAERGAAVTSRLLAFSRRADLQSEPVDVPLLMANMKDMLTHTLGAGIDVRTRIPETLPPLIADKSQLETVLVNLATNARDAMDGMGALTLAAADEVLRQPAYIGEHLMLEPGRYIHLSVTDTGPGMDAATLARATEPFFTTKPQGKGTGLGLAMARGFSEQSGGGIHIESAPGKGTMVHLYFPATAAAKSLPSQDEAASIPPLEARSVRLLMVDDDAMVRDVLEDQMRDAGFVVTACGSGSEALAHLDHGEPVDALIADLSMPVMDGLTLIREARRRRPDLPAILLTGYSTNVADIGVDSDTGGPFLLLRKPIRGNALVERVASLLKSSSAGCPS